MINNSRYMWLLTMIQNSSLDEAEQMQLEEEICDIGEVRAEELLRYLDMHKLDPILSGRNYSRTDINHRLDLILLDEKK